MNFFSLFKRNIIYKYKKKISIDNNNLHENSLDDLFHHYGSDKANFFKKGNREGHGYSKFYTNHLNHLKNEQINILDSNNTDVLNIIIKNYKHYLNIDYDQLNDKIETIIHLLYIFSFKYFVC